MPKVVTMFLWVSCDPLRTSASNRSMALGPERSGAGTAWMSTGLSPFASAAR
jgi:hypothetical protein